MANPQFPSQQNTPINPRQQDTPLDNNSQQTPLQPGQPMEPVSSPIPGQPTAGAGLNAGQTPMNPDQELATPEEREQLMELLEASRDKMAELQSMKFRSENEREVNRVETLKEILLMMQDVGVDLNDAASVGQFLDKLQNTNPDMANRFEEVLEDLLGDDAMSPPADQGIPPTGPVGPTPPTGATPPQGPTPPTGAPAAPMPPTGAPAGPQQFNQGGLAQLNKQPNAPVPEDIRGPVPGQSTPPGV